MTDRWKAKTASHSPWKTPQRCPHFHRCEYDYALKQKGIIIDREREKYLTMIRCRKAAFRDGTVLKRPGANPSLGVKSPFFVACLLPIRRVHKLLGEGYTDVVD